MTKRWESVALTGEIRRSWRGAGCVRGTPRGDRLDDDLDGGVGLEFYAAHPEDAAFDFDDRPGSSVLTCNFHSFNNFLDLPGTGGVTEMDAIAGLP